MSKKKRKMSKLDEQIVGLFIEEAPTVNFIFEDGSKLAQNVNDKFLYQNGRKRMTLDIKDDLFALKNDLGAKRFELV